MKLQDRYPALKDRILWVGTTQAAIAAKLHMKEGKLNLMLDGRIHLPVEVAIEIAKILGKPVEELFSNVEEEK